MNNMAPSDLWTGYRDWDRDSEHAQNIEQLLLTANFSYLCTTASRLRSSLDGKTKGSKRKHHPLACSIDSTKFASGSHNVVVDLKFSDSALWVVRIRLPTDPDYDISIEASMNCEITTMKFVSSRTAIPIPRVHGFDVSSTNPLGFRYVLMEALSGHIIDDKFSKSVPQTQWDKVAEQFANYHHQLSILRSDRISCFTSGPTMDDEPTTAPYNAMGPFSTCLEYFYCTRKNEIRSIKAAHGDDEQWSTVAWILEQALPSRVIEEYFHGPFPLCHTYLHYNNILVDEDYNITGIIDWSEAQTVPLERFMISPEFITYPGL
jgi:hypothetical protein